MKEAHLPALRSFALAFILPGLAGLIVAAMISANYLTDLPRLPDPPAMRLVPRNIHGIVVYQTEKEDRTLDLLEYSSVAVFLIGLGMGLVYLRKWGIARAIEAEDDEFASEEV
jgi:hypothetical protein